MTNNRYSAEDVEVLYRYVGDLPALLVIQVHRCWASQNDRPIRSSRSILRKIHELGLSSYSTGEWITVGTIAGYLGVSCKVVRRWITRRDGNYHDVDGRLNGRQLPLYSRNTRDRYKKSRWFVKRSDLRDFARRNPHLFNHLDRPTLVELMDQEKAADDVLSVGQRVYCRATMPRPVRCIETGAVFPSISAAARAIPIATSSIWHSLTHGSSSGGLHWEDVA